MLKTTLPETLVQLLSVIALVAIANPSQAIEPTNTQATNILMIAGAPSHGYGAHEHYAGLKLLEPEVADSGATVTVVRGWPEDDALVEAADSIVIYCDGGRRHLAIEHLDRLQEKMDEGCGLVCLHYAVETVPGDVGDRWLDLLGGHFEIHYSVNPHWTAKFESFPSHPITKGIEPFAANDEWYFHLRFKDDGVTPILSDVAPEETMRRSDGHHSGNTAARKSVASGESQTVAWGYDRPAGGRAFGFTGGHFHWNWANPNIRRLVTQAILWTGSSESTPKSTSKSMEPLPMKSLLANQDYDPPQGFNETAVYEAYTSKPEMQPAESQ